MRVLILLMVVDCYERSQEQIEFCNVLLREF